MTNTTMSEREIEVTHDGRDVILCSNDDRIRLRPGQVLDAGIYLMDCAERLVPGSWRALSRMQREAAV